MFLMRRALSESVYEYSIVDSPEKASALISDERESWWIVKGNLPTGVKEPRPRTSRKAIPNRYQRKPVI